MEQAFEAKADPEGWDWLESGPSEMIESDELARSFARCLSGHDGGAVLRHLKKTVLDRRLGPEASDSALRYLEGQRSVAAHILSMVERGSS